MFTEDIYDLYKKWQHVGQSDFNFGLPACLNSLRLKHVWSRTVGILSRLWWNLPLKLQTYKSPQKTQHIHEKVYKLQYPESKQESEGDKKQEIT